MPSLLQPSKNIRAINLQQKIQCEQRCRNDRGLRNETEKENGGKNNIETVT